MAWMMPTSKWDMTVASSKASKTSRPPGPGPAGPPDPAEPADDIPPALLRPEPATDAEGATLPVERCGLEMAGCLSLMWAVLMHP